MAWPGTLLRQSVAGRRPAGKAAGTAPSGLRLSRHRPAAKANRPSPDRQTVSGVQMRWGRVHDSADERVPNPSAAWLAMELVIGAVTALRIAFLLTSPLGLDFEEAQYWMWAQSPDWGYYSKPPMIAWIIAAATGVCGDSEACIRLPSPLLHAATALVIGAIGREFGGPRLAFWSATGYALTPGVSFSAVLMTTDVPLLLFWSLAFWSLLRFLRSGRPAWAVAVGAAAGLGTLSKYSMLLFPACLLLHLALDPAARQRIRPRDLAVMAMIGAAIVLPNAIWNLRNGLLTVQHTAALAGIREDYFDPRGLLAFLLAQFALCGPVAFTVLLLRFLVIRPRDDERLALLWNFSIPLLWLFLAQSLVAGGYGNWGAPTYVAGLVLVMLSLLASGEIRIARISLSIHLVAALAMYLVGTLPTIDLPGLRPIPVAARLHGWDRLGVEVARSLEESKVRYLLATDRRLLSLLGYYAGVSIRRMVIWNPDGRVDNHFEYVTGPPRQQERRYLLISETPKPKEILSRFRSVRSLEPVSVQAAPGVERRYWLYTVAGFKGY